MRIKLRNNNRSGFFLNKLILKEKHTGKLINFLKL